MLPVWIGSFSAPDTAEDPTCDTLPNSVSKTDSVEGFRGSISSIER